MTVVSADFVTFDSDEKRWQGYAGLVPLLVPVDSIQSHPRNPRRGDLAVIAGSLQSFGQTKPVVVQASTGYVTAGNHTRLAARDLLGWTHIAASPAEMDDATALAYLAADNRSSDLGRYDDAALSAILEELSAQGRLADTGYDDADLAKLLADQERLAAEAVPAEPAPDPDRPPPRPAGSLHEVVLFYEGDERFSQVSTWLRMLRREWRSDSDSEIVAEALRRAAEAL